MNVATAWERSPGFAAAGTWGEAEAWGRRRPTSSWEETELLRGTLSRPAGTKDSAAARGHSGTEPALAQLQGSHQGDTEPALAQLQGSHQGDFFFFFFFFWRT